MNLTLLVILLIISALFSGSETAFFSLRRPEVARLAAMSDRRGPRVAGLVNRAHELLSAILVGNLLVNTATSVVATSLCLEWFGSRGLYVAVPVVTLALLVVGEITPKMLALRFREPLALLIHLPLLGWVWLCRPLLALISRGTGRLIAELPWERTGSRPLKTGELETACDLAVEAGTLTQTEGRFLARLLLLQHLDVRQIMTPRPEVVTIDEAWTREEILAVATEAGFNRYPVVSQQRPQPCGLFHLKDMLVVGEGAGLPASRRRELLFVPESKDVDALLTEFRSGQTHLAAVVDEHGDFTGIVTLADCLDALIGLPGTAAHLADPEVIRLGPRNWVLSGRQDLREVFEACGIVLPEHRDYVTLAGFLMAQLGRIPRPGDELLFAGHQFTVLEMTDHKVVRVQVLPVPDNREGARP